MRGAREFLEKTNRRELAIKEGVDSDTARSIVKMIKDRKLKVQAAIQENQVRVTGKKIDDLQELPIPGGTITGCPKVRCMQIIAELEAGRIPSRVIRHVEEIAEIYRKLRATPLDVALQSICR